VWCQSLNSRLFVANRKLKSQTQTQTELVWLGHFCGVNVSVNINVNLLIHNVKQKTQHTARVLPKCVVLLVISREISRATASTRRARFDCIFKANADCATGVWCVFYVHILKH
jgi:hypothetical protein